MNIKQEIETLKEKIAELEKELGKAQEKKYPDEDTSIYTVTPLGEVSSFTWRGFSADEEKTLMLMFDSGELFLTKEDAEEYAEVQQIERELYALADDNKEWGTNNPHYYLYYSHNSSSCHISYMYSQQKHVPYFASAESAIEAIEKVGNERVIKWLTYKRKRQQI